MSYRIESIDKHLEAISDELIKFEKEMQDVVAFRTWLFDRKPVRMHYVEKHVRNEETGNMEKVMAPKTAFVPTSNGHKQVHYLIDMAKLSELEVIAEKVDESIDMIINKTVNDEAYYVEDDTRGAIVIPFEYDLRDICRDYLTLPLDMQNKDVLLKFFENEKIIENIGALGYNITKLLMTEFKDDLTSKDISKLSEYIESRLWKMEDKIKAIENKPLDKEVKEAIGRIVNGQPQGKAYTQDLINRLKKCNSKERHYIKAKYNRELSRYFDLLEPYGESNEYNGANSDLVNLYEDLKKTYDILNDPMYVEASRRNDESIRILKNYLANYKANRKQSILPQKEETSEKKTAKKGKVHFWDPLKFTDDDIMD